MPLPRRRLGHPWRTTRAPPSAPPSTPPTHRTGSGRHVGRSRWSPCRWWPWSSRATSATRSRPRWSTRHPAWLIALNARNRNLALVTNHLDPWTYYGIGIVRLLLSDPLFFLLGYWYGDAAVAWMERRTKTWGQMLRQIEGWFGKAAYPLVFFAPNNPICLFAGAAGMPIKAFFAVNIGGHRVPAVAGAAVRRGVRGAARRPRRLDRRQPRHPRCVVSLGLVVLSIALEAKRGETEVSALAHLDEEIDEIDAEKDDDGEGEGDT